MALPPQQNPYPRPVQRELKFDVIGEAFNAMTANWKVFALAGAITAGPVLVMAIIGYIIMIAVMMPSIMSNRDPSPFVMLPAQLLFYVLMLVGYAMGGPGYLGCARIALAIRRKEPLTTDMAKIGLTRIVQGSIAGGIVYGGVLLGTMCCYVPGFLWGGLSTGAYTAMVLDENLAPMDAAKESMAVMKPQMWMAALLYFVASLIAGLGAIACLIGVIFTMPLLAIIMGLSYMDMKFGIGQSDRALEVVPPVSQ